jgi:glycosyltransferase involved in cell wall biosynthesis
LAHAINELGCDEAKRKQLGAAGQNAVRTHLSWQAVSRGIDELYRSVIASKR